MRINTNNWNKIRYTLYLPFYDSIGNIFKKERKKSIEILSPKPDDHILLLGGGTGLDLEYLKGYRNITAIDITPSMINKLNRRARSLNITVNALVMDGHKLTFPNETFDAVIMHLIISVIPNPYLCIKEVERVLKQGGNAVILDKFLLDDVEPTTFRKLINHITSFFFSDINRRINDILKGTNFKKVIDIPIKFSGAFRIIKIAKLP